MIALLKQLFQSQTQALSPQEQERQLNLAAASMLLEVVYADETLSESEAELLPQLLVSTLGILASEAEQVLVEAKRAQRNATSLYEFTAEINRVYSIGQKQQLLLAMWRLAYADGRLCQYEDQIIRRTADLLYLKHSELIRMRNLAKEQTD
ncbi:TerB family tellurite resistance protein [Shewanella salipaludis]|uniref:TerB family tellurite resistance protein n=1 Tax=Shewanella salipaludis TaxID=2723052 RepID=A0A972FTM8_9GAMM|nr:TerB family tellurite resistance protein [Shewanella salipaludis]NMH65059.1 TerB family tellurite resistance protein [Shewanella salipaludis]